MDVYFYEAFEEEARHLKHWLPTSVSAGFFTDTIQESEDQKPPARIISIRTQSKIPPEWSDQIDAVLTRSTGYDHILDYRGLTGTNLPAGYLPLYCNRAVAEQALMLWMGLLRKIKRQISQFNQFWRDHLTGQECSGKNLLVVGVGHIGYEVVRIGRGLDMTVLGVDIEPKHDFIDYVDIETGIAKADIIVCAMSLNHDNHGYFDRIRWLKARRGAIFVNVARGEMAPVADLIWALDQGILSGVGVDVYDRESDLATAMRTGVASDALKEIDLFLEHPNVICTPHNAFNTLEAVERKSQQSIEQVVWFLEKGHFKWPVP